MWFANGMSEYEVMRLAGHSDFATTHKFYLAVADGLVDRARVAVAKGLRQIMVQNGAEWCGRILKPKKRGRYPQEVVILQGVMIKALVAQ